MKLLLVVVLIDLIAIYVWGEPTAVVNTTSGPVQGKILTTVVNSVPYAAFTGIRFGKAPLGYLRFKPPLPVDPWTETFNATSPGNECPQMDSITNSVKGSEDCLFLSVYTTVTNLTTTPTELKSVMVWIYGGAFVYGSQSDARHHPDYLLERHVVYVSINYRLGALGFLTLDHKNATGNAGLKDQVLALKWVQANIAKFGGNPNNVTIFGESAGGASVGFHVLSESSAGLFHGAISMSGAPLMPWGFTAPAEALTRAFKLGALIGEVSLDKDQLLKAFYAAPAEELVQKAPYTNPLITFTPTLEDAKIATDVFISECVVNKYNTGNFTKVPQLLGFMEQETVSFTGFTDIFRGVVDGALNVFPAPILSVVENMLKPGVDVVTALGDATLELAINATSDLLFKLQIDTTQRLVNAKNDDKPVYYYHMTFTSNNSLHMIEDNATTIGAGHTDDLAYIFYVPYANDIHNLSDPTALTAYRVTTMWTNFAKYGNPTPDWVDEYPLGVTWPTSGCAGKALNIGNKLTVDSRPIDASTQAIEVAKYLTLSGDSGCISRTNMPTCQTTIGSLIPIQIPIFNSVPISSSLRTNDYLGSSEDYFIGIVQSDS